MSEESNPLHDVVSEALAQHPLVTQVLGCMGKGIDGLLVVIDGEQFVVEFRPRHEGESFTLYELPDLGDKGKAQ